MKRYMNAALLYAVLAMAGGVFYREFTKFTGFTAKTTLSVIHTHYFMLGMAVFLLLLQRRKVKDFFIKFTKKSHFADFLTEQTLDFVLHRLFCGLAEMDTDDIGCLADLLSDSRASGGVSCGIVHSKSSCK